MNSTFNSLRLWLLSGGGQRLGRVWLAATILKRLECAYQKEAANLLLLELAALEKSGKDEHFARATDLLLLKPQRTITILMTDLKSARKKNTAQILTSTEKLQYRYELLRQQVKTLLDQDSDWRTRADGIKVQRTELWEEAVKWAPKWQHTVKGFIKEVDISLNAARHAKNPDNQLELASRAKSRLRGALEYVAEVNKTNIRATRAAIHLERLRPVSGSYLSQDTLSFHETLKAGQQAFSEGEYVAARRHLDAALQLAKNVVTGVRIERLKRKAEARQWVGIIANKEISADIENVLSHSSSPEFVVEWAELHKKIDDLVLARACEMGNRDQKTIANRIGIKRTVKWREQMKWDDLSKFAQAMVKELSGERNGHVD